MNVETCGKCSFGKLIDNIIIKLYNMQTTVALSHYIIVGTFLTFRVVFVDYFVNRSLLILSGASSMNFASPLLRHLDIASGVLGIPM